MSGRGETRAGLLVAQLVLAAVILLAWEWGAATGVLNPFFFSRPSAVVLRIGHWIGTGIYLVTPLGDFCGGPSFLCHRRLTWGPIRISAG